MFYTRRNFLMDAARAGGYSAAFAMMQAMELMPAATTVTVPVWPHDAGKGSRALILGAGIAGLTAAYEMGKAGFKCTVLEARERPGGRNWTVRGGTRVEFNDGTQQTPDWKPDGYFNAGPSRLPSIHTNILNYCRELGVELQIEIGSSRSALLVNPKAFAGQPVEQRQAINDTRGHVSAMLAKCIHQHALDDQLTAADRERMLDFLRAYGDLKRDRSYTGSERAGATRFGGAGDVTQELRPPLGMNDLLAADFWRGMLFEEGVDYQATMFQPVGGMDRIAYAFAKRLGQVVQYRAAVTQIRKTPNGVRIEYEQGRSKKTIEADYCICCLPAPVLKNIPADFAPRLKAAIEASSGYSDAYKIAWESKRFWELEDNIYGGISFLSGHPVNQVCYPSGNLFAETGIVVAGDATERGTAFGALPNVDAKLAASRAAVELLHPDRGKELTHPVYVNWGKIPWSLGSWIAGKGVQAGPDNAGGIPQVPSFYEGAYKEFLQADDRFYFAGDHCSHIGAWQEGAVVSAHRAIQMIWNRVREEKTGGTGKNQAKA